MDVEEYLRHVREEEAALPDVCVARSTSMPISSDGKTAKQFEHLKKIDDESLCLDSGYRLGENEMQYFRAMKSAVNAKMTQASSQEKCGLVNHCIELISDGTDESSRLHKLDDACWHKIFASDPPDIVKLCTMGISFATVHEILYRLASFVCDSKGKNINEKSSNWLFTIFLVLDELHAMIESVSYELQRIKRALGRYLRAIRDNATNGQSGGAEASEQLQRDIASVTLNICIIQQHFNQK
ncbi:hypothetical protein X943_000877 [Babesia divergens]|uniref:Uncharacterized protein n=1 Tax=Babesia divergens TaxID=32595 RepID=A0AAD9GJE0_BABDI|nr:hypothetical protein X943_000877 [Babesia divergens]